MEKGDRENRPFHAIILIAGAILICCCSSKIDLKNNSIAGRSALAFNFEILSISPNFSIDDMPQGSNPWTLQGRIVKVSRGKWVGVEGHTFETIITIYQGPVGSRPAGLWINEIPAVHEIWTLYGGEECLSSAPEELLRDSGAASVRVIRSSKKTD